MSLISVIISCDLLKGTFQNFQTSIKVGNRTVFRSLFLLFFCTKFQVTNIEMKRLKKIKLIFILICLCGCVYQIQKISYNYFQYRTDTTVSVQMDDTIDDPKLTVCFNLLGMIQNGDSLVGQTPDGSKSIKLEELTVEEAFNRTPSFEQLIKSCRIRSRDDYRIANYNKSECIAKFDITKVLQRNDICYQFGLEELSDDQLARIRKYSYTPIDPNVVFGITFQPGAILGSSYVYGFADENNTSATIDSLFITPWELGGSGGNGGESSGNSGSEKANTGNLVRKLLISYGLVLITRLPPPYQTNCMYHDSGHLSKDSKQYGCINEKLGQQLNKSSFSYFLSLDSPNVAPMARLTTHSDLENETFRHEYDGIEKECTSDIREDVCSLYFTFSSSIMVPSRIMSESEEQSAQDSLIVFLSIPQNPSVNVTHSPMQNIEEFLVLVSSCFGTWLGLSALTGLETITGIISHVIDDIISEGGVCREEGGVCREGGGANREGKVDDQVRERIFRERIISGKRQRERELSLLFEEKFHPRLMREVSYIVNGLLKAETEQNLEYFERNFVRRAPRIELQN